MNWKGIIMLWLMVMTSCKPSPSEIINYNWLVGTWQNDRNYATERWHKINNLSYQGMGYVNKENEISVSEYLRLYRLNDKWNFSAIVRDQNNGKEVVFKSTKNCSNSILEVEALSHDYPKRIKYELLQDSLVKITLNEHLENEHSYHLKKIPYFEIEVDRVN